MKNEESYSPRGFFNDVGQIEEIDRKTSKVSSVSLEFNENESENNNDYNLSQEKSITKQLPSPLEQEGNQKAISIDDINKEGNIILRPLIAKFIAKLRNITSFRKIDKNSKHALSMIKDKSVIQHKFHEISFCRNFNSIVLSLLPSWLTNLKTIHPHYWAKCVWDIIQLIASGFFIFYFQFSLGFNFYFQTIYYWIYLIMFVINWILNLNTAKFISGVLVTNRKLVLAKQLKAELFIDIIIFSSLIANHVYWGDIEMKKETQWEAIIRSLFVLTVFKLQKIFDGLEEKYRFLQKQIWLNILVLICQAIFVCHFVACIFHQIAISPLNPYQKEASWIIANNLQNEALHIQYLYSLYFAAVTLMTVGYGDIRANSRVEIAFVTIVILFGTTFFGFILSTVGSLLQTMKKKKEKLL